MRVRTGRFRRVEKVTVTETSKAGYGTGRQSRFTWSGAMRPLRSARLTLCRRFRPSPCPTHYDGRWAVGSEEARSRARLRPPPKLDVRVSRIRLSRGCVALSGKRRNQSNKVPPHLLYPLEPWASLCCANSPADRAFYAIRVPRLAPLHLGFLRTSPRGLALALR
jgi:hypothetical protein